MTRCEVADFLTYPACSMAATLTVWVYGYPGVWRETQHACQGHAETIRTEKEILYVTYGLSVPAMMIKEL